MGMEEKKTMVGLEATKVQIGGQQQMHQESLRLKSRELDIKEKDALAGSRDKAMELDSRERQTAQRVLSDAERAKADRDFNDISDRRKMAFELNDLKEGSAPTDGLNP